MTKNNNTSKVGFNKKQPNPPGNHNKHKGFRACYFIWIILIVVLCIPFISQINPKSKSAGLYGEIAKTKKAKFSFSSWLSADYQRQTEEYTKDTWTFREKLTRLNNQINYSVFNKIQVDGFVLGKDNYVFSKGYIDSYTGKDFIGEEAISELIRKTRVLQDTLAKKNIDLIVVYAPGKGSYCSEYISDKYNIGEHKKNITYFLEQSKVQGLNYLDLYSSFLLMKGKTKYPLFPQFGHHWSYYGECVAADTIIKYIEKLRKVDLPEFNWSEIEVSDTCRSRDGDVLKSMNLLYRPVTFPMAYPKIKFEDNPQKNKTKLLAIADSYYWGMVYMGIPNNVFKDGEFWYYYNKTYPKKENKVIEAWELDLKKKIENSNVIMILAADGNLPKLGWGFIEDAYLLYTNPQQFYVQKEKAKKILVLKKQIHETPIMLNQLKKESEVKKITLDSAINMEARRMNLMKETPKTGTN